MDVKFLSQVRSLASLRQESELESALSELLAGASGEAPLTIKGVRDKFTTVNRHAKSGRIQVVKGPPGGETLIVSVKSLAAIIRAASASFYFTDALKAAGFKPIGHRLVLNEGFERDDTLTLDPTQGALNPEEVPVQEARPAATSVEYWAEAAEAAE